MNKSMSSLSEIKLVGIKVRTKNANEMDPATAKIAPTIGEWFGKQLSEKLSHRTSPGTTFCVYTEYDSDEHGEYSYFVGEQVSAFATVDPSMEVLTIPASQYAQFECGPGPMPQVCINAWQNLWQMTESDFGGKRSYVADFEIYDERAQDPSNTTLDIYIGIR